MALLKPEDLRPKTLDISDEFPFLEIFGHFDSW